MNVFKKSEASWLHCPSLTDCMHLLHRHCKHAHGPDRSLRRRRPISRRHHGSSPFVISVDGCQGKARARSGACMCSCGENHLVRGSVKQSGECIMRVPGSASCCQIVPMCSSDRLPTSILCCRASLQLHALEVLLFIINEACKHSGFSSGVNCSGVVSCKLAAAALFFLGRLGAERLLGGGFLQPWGTDVSLSQVQNFGVCY